MVKRCYITLLITSGKNVDTTTNAKMMKKRKAISFFPETNSRPTNPANA